MCLGIPTKQHGVRSTVIISCLVARDIWRWIVVEAIGCITLGIQVLDATDLIVLNGSYSFWHNTKKAIIILKSVTVHQLILHASMIMQDGARYLKFPSKAPTIGDIHKKMNRIKITSEIFFFWKSSRNYLFLWNLWLRTWLRKYPVVGANKSQVTNRKRR